LEDPETHKLTKSPTQYQSISLKPAHSHLSENAPAALEKFDVLLAQASKSRLSKNPLKPKQIRLNRGSEAQP